ncbi:uncharacterized protein LOC123879310 [Maniola jurtina]|uniref:uncharacterized protein LOC123879310 n=1 Tax=Maniola jurtina TaxID=191418 RepID=UPI001E68D6D8|nr:uncharacterized protein LOC123879310 [Maniola jurtina]
MSTRTYFLLLLIIMCSTNFVSARKKKSAKPYNETKPSSKYDNPNFIRDRYHDEIWKPIMNESWVNRFKKPFNPVWMDYCDPYHCNAYHKPACGLNRRTMRFKWFQSRCHILLNNLCAYYRGALKYDIVDTQHCLRYVMFLRVGCPTVCPDMLDPICGVSSVDNQVAIFMNKCTMDRANCRRRFSDVQYITESSFKSTLSQRERIKILRHKIKEEIRSKTNRSSLISPLDIEDSSIEDLDYKLNERLPITPIIENTVKYKSRGLTTVKFDSKIGGKAAIDKSQDGGAGKENKTLGQLRSQKRIQKKVRVRKPLEIFYRRIYNKELFEQHLDWVHCQDIITPFLTGAMVNLSNLKAKRTNDPTVVRLISLLNVNTTTYGRDDVYAILYQISQLKLRFFQWDVSSIKMLFNVIIKQKIHTFGSLKRGLRELFSKWQLDFSNTTTLLRQARIFRPPCVYTATFDGSTKSPKVTKYPKKNEKPTTVCEYDEEDCKD